MVKILQRFVIMLMLVMLVQPAQAQDFYDKNLKTRLQQIERQIQTMSRYIYRLNPEALKDVPEGAVNDLARVPTELIPDDSPDAGSQADLQVRLDAVEGDVRQLTGQLEEQNYLLGVIGDKLEKLSDKIPATKDLNTKANDNKAATAPATLRRLNALEGQMKGLQSKMSKVLDETTRIRVQDTVTEYSGVQPTPQSDEPMAMDADKSDTINDTVETKTDTLEPSTAKASQDTSTPSRLYQNAFSLLQNGEYNKAQVEFRNYLDNYPEHELVDNAKYWIAETHYVQKDFQKAARLFATAYQDAPDSQKAPDNLLKLALSLAALDKKTDACVTLKQMENGFNNLRAPLERRMKSEQERLNCL